MAYQTKEEAKAASKAGRNAATNAGLIDIQIQYRAVGDLAAGLDDLAQDLLRPVINIPHHPIRLAAFGPRAVLIVYQRHDWAAEKRAALETWAAHVTAVVAGRTPTGNPRPGAAGRRVSSSKPALPNTLHRRAVWVVGDLVDGLE